MWLICVLLREAGARYPSLCPCPVAHPYQSLFIWLLDLLLALVGFEPEPVCTSKTVPWFQVSICATLCLCVIWLWVSDCFLLSLFRMCYATREGDLPLIVAIDLQPMAPIEGVIQVQGDITNARTAEVVSWTGGINFHCSELSSCDCWKLCSCECFARLLDILMDAKQIWLFVMVLLMVWQELEGADP